jgi:hypothetical protein
MDICLWHRLCPRDPRATLSHKSARELGKPLSSDQLGGEILSALIDPHFTQYRLR